MKRIFIALALVVRAVAPLAAQTTTSSDTFALSLEEALHRAATKSEEVQLAESQVSFAAAQVHDARAGAMPQINGAFGYTRTFSTQFEMKFELPDSMKFEPDSLASTAQRLRYLEDKTPIAGLAGLGSLFGNLPFGRTNAYAATVSGSQLLYSGGKVGAALEAARRYNEAAHLQLTEQLADIDLSVRTAYYRALFAQEIEHISALAVEQADTFLKQEKLRESTGASSELDVLRAEVALANLKPQMVQARNAAELAILDLKRLVNIPAKQPLHLTTQLEAPAADRLAGAPEVDDAVLEQRAAVQAAQRQVRMRELGVKVAKGAFLPNLAISMNYARYAYPTDAFKLGGVDWRSDWTAGLGLSIPIFDGLRRMAQIDQAQAQLLQARLQLSQLQEAVTLQYRQAVGERERAALNINARQTTVKQAQRVYDLTVLRYDKGLATQLEVSDARLALLSARTNLAQALSDFYIAEATVARATVGTQNVRSR